MENITEIEQLKFPVGPFNRKEKYSNAEFSDLVSVIRQAPGLYRDIAATLSDADLLKNYRPGSWNVRQLFHHVADIQLLHFFRMKQALTEPDYENVTLVRIDQWAGTSDAVAAPVEDSLIMLEGITKRYVFLIGSLTEDQSRLSYFHPVRKFSVDQRQAVAMSAWHLQHHLAHIRIAVTS